MNKYIFLQIINLSSQIANIIINENWNNRPTLINEIIKNNRLFCNLPQLTFKQELVENSSDAAFHFDLYDNNFYNFAIVLKYCDKNVKNQHDIFTIKSFLIHELTHAYEFFHLSKRKKYQFVRCINHKLYFEAVGKANCWVEFVPYLNEIKFYLYSYQESELYWKEDYDWLLSNLKGRTRKRFLKMIDRFIKTEIIG